MGNFAENLNLGNRFRPPCGKVFLSIQSPWRAAGDPRLASGVARAFPGGRVAHPEGQNEEENK